MEPPCSQITRDGHISYPGFWQKPGAVARTRLLIVAHSVFLLEPKIFGIVIQRDDNVGQQLDWTRTSGGIYIRSLRVVAISRADSSAGAGLSQGNLPGQAGIQLRGTRISLTRSEV